MRLIRPLRYGTNDLVLVTTSVPEDEHPAWSGLVTYAAGDRVIYVGRIYESLLAGNTFRDPDINPVWWANVGPTNASAMFDGAASTSTTATASISVALRVRRPIDSIAFVGLVGDTVTVSTTGSSAQFIEAVIPAPVAPATSSALVIDGLTHAGDGHVQIEIAGAGAVACAAVSFGGVTELGETQAGLRVEIVDYSKKDTDQYGTVRVIRRGYSRRVSCSVAVPYLDVDRVAAEIAYMRQTPALWTLADDLRSATLYGYYADWSLAIRTPTQSIYTITIESLAENSLQLLPGETPTTPEAIQSRSTESGGFRRTEDGIIRELE